MSIAIRRGNVVSFATATWTALVLLDGADQEVQVQVGQWVQPAMMAASSDVAVLMFDPTNSDDGLVLGPYGALGLQDLNTTASPTLAGLFLTVSDAGTVNQPNLITLDHETSGTPGVAFGSALLWNLQTTTTASQPAAYDQIIWVDPTHASRKARRALSVYDTASREIVRMEGLGAAGGIGFLGAAAVARASAYTQTYATTSRTHANPTATTPTAYAAGANGYSTAAKAQEMRDQIAALVADMANIKQLVNSMVDDLQALGLVG